MVLPPERALLCLDELEREFLRVGGERCTCLEEQSQLSAFLRLGVRAVSLLRGLLSLLQPGTLDSFDAVRRAFLETWQLQFEFRIAESVSKTARWFQGQGNSWSSNPGIIADFIEGLGHDRPEYGREYGDLSGLAHPTEPATVNSCAIASSRWNISSLPGNVDAAVAELSEELTGLLVREIWIVDAKHERLIGLHISEENIPACQKLLSDFIAEHEGSAEKGSQA